MSIQGKKLCDSNGGVVRGSDRNGPSGFALRSQRLVAGMRTTRYLRLSRIDKRLSSVHCHSWSFVRNNRSSNAAEHDPSQTPSSNSLSSRLRRRSAAVVIREAIERGRPCKHW